MNTFSGAQTIDFAQYIEYGRSFIEKQLEQYLHNQPSDKEPKKLWESMRYSVLAGGKRFRALLCLASAEAVSSENNTQLRAKILPCCCAIELVHAMSLIHDDLPALDNDDLRRGKPSNHKVFGEAIALLAGDALLALANEILITHTPASIDACILLAVLSELARAIGPEGMVGGQVLDMQLTGQNAHCDPEIIKHLPEIHSRKTGALIRFSAWSGAKLAGANSTQLENLTQFGEVLGLAFQIADDLLDINSNALALGKTPGKDEINQKVTWVTVFGHQRAEDELRELEKKGAALLSQAKISQEASHLLKKMLDYAIHRTN